MYVSSNAQIGFAMTTTASPSRIKSRNPSSLEQKILGSAAAASCSVCLEPVADGGNRSVAKLVCGHQFHLDCIGSAFNAKSTMQCPNCRHIENGEWLYANGRQSGEPVADGMFDGLYSGSAQLFLNLNWMGVAYVPLYPYQSIHEEDYLSTFGVNQQPASYSQQEENNNFLPSCPYVQAYGLRVHGHLPQLEEDSMLQDRQIRSTPTAYPSDHHVFSSLETWDQRTGAAASTGISGMELPDSRTPRGSRHMHQYNRNNLQVANNSVQQRAGGVWGPIPRFNIHLNGSHYRILPPTQVAMQYAHTDEHGPTHWVYNGIHNAADEGQEAGHINGTANTAHWALGGTPAFSPHPYHQGQRLQSGLYSWPANHDPGLSTQGASLTMDARYIRQFQGNL